MVYGFASTPDLDSDGEIIKLEALEKALPEYMKFPTIREMHMAKPAGKTVSAEIRDKGQKGLYIGAKIVTDEAWNLVKEGVYKAFSIGGNVISKVGNVIQELELVEISLVDVPANKAAVIEVWKSNGDPQMIKNANTAYSLADIMIRIKDTISYYEWLGKDTKKLSKILEQIKEQLAVEATETEAEAEANMETMMDWSDAVTYFKTMSTALEEMDLSDNKVADSLRKEVIVAMNKKAEELKKEEELKAAGESEAEVVTPVEETPTDETPVTEPEAPTEEVTPEAGEETPATETPEAPADGGEAEEEKETSQDANLTKLAEVNTALDKMAPATEVEKKEQPGLAKAVEGLTDTLLKMASILEKQESRIAQLEKTPAAPKGKAGYVFKSEEEKPTSVKTDGGNPVADKLAAKKARHEELVELHTKLGAALFAKQGYSQEAGSLINEIQELEAKLQTQA